MLKLFQSLFGGDEGKGRYPESLIEMAIERAVDGTDPRLRVLPGYRKRLRAPFIHAADHVVALVDSLPPPLAAASSDYGSDPRLMALFASPEHMREVLGNSPTLREYRDQQADTGLGVPALLLAERIEKNILGLDLAGEVMRREVAQVTVNFHGHRLVDPAASEEESRRLLKRRAFDHLLSLALLRITEEKGERADLKRQRDLLRNKLNTLQRGGWNFDEADGPAPQPQALEADLEGIEQQLAELGADSDTLNRHLDIVAEVLAEAERHFWSEDIDLYLDRMNIQRDAQDASAQHLHLQELHNARGRRVATLFVSLKYDELPLREYAFDKAERYLG